MKKCILEPKNKCIECNECTICDLDNKKQCDNCMKCVDKFDGDYAIIEANIIDKNKCKKD